MLINMCTSLVKDAIARASVLYLNGSCKDLQSYGSYHPTIKCGNPIETRYLCGKTWHGGSFKHYISIEKCKTEFEGLPYGGQNPDFSLLECIFAKEDIIDKPLASEVMLHFKAKFRPNMIKYAKEQLINTQWANLDILVNYICSYFDELHSCVGNTDEMEPFKRWSEYAAPWSNTRKDYIEECHEMLEETKKENERIVESVIGHYSQQVLCRLIANAVIEYNFGTDQKSAMLFISNHSDAICPELLYTYNPRLFVYIDFLISRNS